MFAVIKTGGKQYRVEAGDVIVVEKLPVEENGAVTFDEVLMVGDKVGAPHRGRCHRHRRGHEAGPRQEDHRLQEEAPPELPAQERPPPVHQRRAHHRHRRRLNRREQE